MTDRLHKLPIFIMGALLPGAGHLAVGRTRTGLSFMGAFLLHIAILSLGYSRGLLVWMVKYGKGDLFSTVSVFFLLAFIWIRSIISLKREMDDARSTKSQAYWSMVARSFSRNKKGIVGAALLVVVLYFALFAPFFAPHSALKMDLINTLVGPNQQHILGTDNFGRDVLSRIIYGARVALGVGAAATLFNMVLGGVLGLLGGYFGGAVDVVVMRFLEAVNSIPFIVLAILVISVFGAGALNLVLVLGVFGLQPARIIRSKVLSIRKETYIEASRAIGANDLRIIFQHILPNSMAPLLVVTTMMIGTNIITVAGLSFLGFGIKPPTASWGGMLQQAQEYMRVAWWMAVFPGIAIFLTVFGFNILGDALRDALDPKLR